MTIAVTGMLPANSVHWGAEVDNTRKIAAELGFRLASVSVGVDLPHKVLGHTLTKPRRGTVIGMNAPDKTESLGEGREAPQN